MKNKAIKQFRSDELELILLRFRLSGIRAEFWMDSDGFFNYSLSSEANKTLPLSKKSTQINWTRIDEVISQMAYDAARAYPESVFSFWYDEHEESPDYNRITIEQPQALLSKD